MSQEVRSTFIENFKGRGHLYVHSSSVISKKNEDTCPGLGSSVPPQPTDKHPVMILNEIRPGTQYDIVSETGEGDSKNFVMSVSAQKIVKGYQTWLFLIKFFINCVTVLLGLQEMI